MYQYPVPEVNPRYLYKFHKITGILQHHHIKVIYSPVGLSAYNAFAAYYEYGILIPTYQPTKMRILHSNLIQFTSRIQQIKYEYNSKLIDSSAVEFELRETLKMPPVMLEAFYKKIVWTSSQNYFG